jgi:hypothetical protein
MKNNYKALLSILFVGLSATSFAQTQLAIWDFATVANAATNAINATTDAVPGTPSLKQFYQTIDNNGKGGTTYTDANSVAHTAGSAIAWDDIKGSGIDAELQITLSTTGWENIFFRFNYKSESAETFDLRYSLDNGASWTLILDDAAITGDNAYHAKVNNLSAFSNIEDQPTVMFKISELDNTGNDQFVFDNIEFYGSQIALVPGVPSIQAHSSTTRFLNNNTHSGSASGVMSDPTDPCRTKGLNFLLRDSNTPLNTLVVTASSSNTTVVPNANLALTTINDSIRNLEITPAVAGYSDITISVSDGSNSDSYVLNYAASAPTYDIPNTVFHTGISDGSTSIDAGNNYIIAADDETNALLLYHKDSSGHILNQFNVGAAMGLQEEGDFEASCRKGNRAYWMGSLGNSVNGNIKPSRHRFFATDVSASGSSVAVNYVGNYDIRNAIISWGDSHGYNFMASGADGMIPKQIGGLNVEGMCLAPATSTLYIAFRAPLVPVSNRTKALICPVTNFETWFNNGSPSGSPTFGTPIELNLGGRGIRSIEQNANGQFLIVAGSYDSNHNAALYEWDGNPASAPVLLTADLTDLNPEGIVSFPSPFYNGSTVELMSDDGTDTLYNDNIENKLLNDANKKKFRTIKIATTGGTLAPCVGPNLTGVTASQTAICAGGSTTLTITGTLNSATAWQVYTGSCGSVSAGSTATGTMSVSPTATTTYYIRGEGGCTMPGACNTITIQVNPLPVVNTNLSAIDSQCVNTSAIALSGGSPAGGTYSGAGVSGGNFSPAAAGTGVHQITYTYTDANSCVNSAAASMTVLACVGIADQKAGSATFLYPNPTTGNFTIVHPVNGKTKLSIYNTLGQLVKSQELTASGQSINTSTFPAGVYYIQLDNGISVWTNRLIKE